jgi:uncharacterized membrane protein
MVVDRSERSRLAARLVGNSSHHRQLHQLALCAQIHSNYHRLSSVSRGGCTRSTWLLDFSGRIDFAIALVWDCSGRYWTGAGRETDCTDRGTSVSFLAFILIVVSLASFVAAQLILKRAMQASRKTGFRNASFLSKVTIGVILMTISFFLTLGLLQRFDLSYLYPFQGLSVIFITLIAAFVLREKLNLRLALGALLISAGIVLVSLS